MMDPLESMCVSGPQSTLQGHQAGGHQGHQVHSGWTRRSHNPLQSNYSTPSPSLVPNYRSWSGAHGGRKTETMVTRVKSSSPVRMSLSSLPSPALDNKLLSSRHETETQIKDTIDLQTPAHDVDDRDPALQRSDPAPMICSSDSGSDDSSRDSASVEAERLGSPTDARASVSEVGSGDHHPSTTSLISATPSFATLSTAATPLSTPASPQLSRTGGSSFSPSIERTSVSSLLPLAPSPLADDGQVVDLKAGARPSTSQPIARMARLSPYSLDKNSRSRSGRSQSSESLSNLSRCSSNKRSCQETSGPSLLRRRPTRSLDGLQQLSNMNLGPLPGPSLSLNTYDRTNQTRPRSCSPMALVSSSTSSHPKNVMVEQDHPVEFGGATNLAPKGKSHQDSGAMRSTSLPPIPAGEDRRSPSPPPQPSRMDQAPGTGGAGRGSYSDSAFNSDSRSRGGYSSAPDSEGLDQERETEEEGEQPSPTASSGTVPMSILGSPKRTEDTMDRTTAAELAYAYHPHNLYIHPYMYPHLAQTNHPGTLYAPPMSWSHGDGFSYGDPLGTCSNPNPTSFSNATDAVLWHENEMREAQFELRLSPLLPSTVPTRAQWVEHEALLDQDERYRSTQSLDFWEAHRRRNEPGHRRYFDLWPAAPAAQPGLGAVVGSAIVPTDKLLPCVTQLEPLWTEWNWGSSWAGR